MIPRLRKTLGLAKAETLMALRFDRPLVIFQSDDWGRVGVSDREGWNELRAAGLNLGERPYDFYSLETAEDMSAIADVLRKHRDATGRRPPIVMNFILANVDFDQAFDSHPTRIALRALDQGLPGTWHRPRLFEAYREGIREGLFFPALHGLTHFCEQAVAHSLQFGGERAELLQKLWRAQTPYIHWRMPWIGYEYWNPQMPSARRFLSLEEQKIRIALASETFRRLFGSGPLSACAPGYRANVDTRTAWLETGIRVAQNGPGERKAPGLDQNGMLSTFRTVEMEPAIEACDLEKLIYRVASCFDEGAPAVISIHSINFHSTLRDFRSPTLQLLDEFLTTLEKKWPDLLYVHDADLFAIATEGSYSGENGKITVGATRAA